MNSYPSYKSSRMDWLQQIPVDWEEKRAKFFFKEVNNRSETGEEELLSVSHITGVTPRSEKNVNMFMAESYVGHKLCEAGDLVINSLWTWMGALGIARQRGIVSSAYGVYRLRNPAKFNPAYLDNLLRVKGYIGEYLCRSTGIWTSRLGLNPEDFLDLPIICPPIEDQDAIVAYMDSKLADIDRFISEKERLIELLSEQKTAIINQAVIKGIDPKKEMKDSGIKWLGEIPENWDTYSLKQIASVRLSGVDKHTYEGEIPIRLCNYTDVYNGEFITPDLDFMLASATKSEIRNFALLAGDVLITKDSETWDDIAVPAYVPLDLEGVLCGYHLALIRPKAQMVNGEFLFRSLSAPQIEYQSNISANGVTRYGLSKFAIKNILIPVPPVDEQQRICAYLSQEINTISHSISQAQKEMDLIKEFRIALIDELVTGKIKVRN